MCNLTGQIWSDCPAFVIKSHFKVTIPDSLARDAGVIDPDEK